jgi:hypothetical protein
MDHEQFARRVLGMAPAATADDAAALTDDGVAALTPRPCVGCREPTAEVFFDVVSLMPEPPRCGSCREEYLAGLTFSIVETAGGAAAGAAE